MSGPLHEVCENAISPFEHAIDSMRAHLASFLAVAQQLWNVVLAEKLAITCFLVAVSLFVLSRRFFRRRRTGSRSSSEREWISGYPRAIQPLFGWEENDELSITRTSTASSSITTLCAGNALGLDEDEISEEQFEKTWPTIQVSPYSSLVLPPSCKLVDRPVLRGPIQSPKEGKSYGNDDYDLFWKLLVYVRSFLLALQALLAHVHRVSWAAVDGIMARLQISIQDQLQQEERDAKEDGKGTERKEPEQESREAYVEGETAEEEKNDKSPSDPQGQRESIYENPLTDLTLAGLDDSGHQKGTPTSPWIPIDVPKVNKDQKGPFERLRSSLARNHAKAQVSPKPDRKRTRFATQATAMGLPPPAEKSRERADSLSFFDAAHSHASLKRLHVEVPVPDRNGYILGDEFLSCPTVSPLLVFVNSRSGPQQGHLLIMQLRRLLNPIQVWDLADGGPEKVLESFSVLSRLRLLVCGGDGTVSWIISALEKMGLQRWPPIAILPLGTGNDLARIHGWGGGYNNESLISILEQVSQAYVSMLDRWELIVEDKNGKLKEKKSFFNYLGVGVDAQAALQVHMLRKSNPMLFFSRAVNKAWYALFGAEDAIKASHANLPHELTLIADGVEVPLPSDSQGIILLNIDSYAGGVPMWSHGVKSESLSHEYDSVAPRRVKSLASLIPRNTEEPAFAKSESLDYPCSSVGTSKMAPGRLESSSCDMPSSCQDGKLDIVSIRGSVHLGQIRVGLSNAQKLCQTKEVKIVINKTVAVQTDGEPWRQSACTLRVRRKKDQAIMLHRSNQESGGIETEMVDLLDWAEERKIIDRNAHTKLMREFSRRVERKTRQQRVRVQDRNLITALRRAIMSGGPTDQSP